MSGPDTIEQLDLLILRAQTGDVAAFEGIVRRFQDMAVGYAYSVLGDFHLAEDAAQEAFVEAYRDLNRVYCAAAFPAWLRRVTYKRCDRILRKKQPDVVDPGTVDSILVAASDPLEVLVKKETRQIVRSAIGSLPEEERQVTTLYHLGGCSYREIASFLGLSPSTVDNRLRSSRRRLRASMDTAVRETLPAARPSRDERFTHKVALFNAVEAEDMDKVKQLLNTDAARGALYDFLCARAEEQGRTVEELVVQVIQQYKEHAEKDDEVRSVFRERVGSAEKQEALRQIEAYLDEATFHKGSIIEIARLVPEASCNVAALAHCAWLASKFGYHTGSLVRLAMAAASAETEVEELTALADLVVLKGSETQVMVKLAEEAAGPLSEEDKRKLAQEVARLQSTADFPTLEAALEWQASQGWAKVEMG